jgi:hypothetical protein
MSVCPSFRVSFCLSFGVKQLDPTARICIKIEIWAFFEIQVSLKPDKNEGHFTSGPIYVYDVLLSSS